MLPSYVVLDLETTGGRAASDGVTEIAAVRVDNGLQTERWSTLVNPGSHIPPFIQNLTGITDAMVADAPSFRQVADKLRGLLDGSVLVAHNAGFDHGFLRSEFGRLGHDLQVPSLCTVRLSRKLYPQFRSHSLDALMQRHGLHTDARHRAMGDVDMVLAWLEQARAEFGEGHLRSLASELLQPPLRLPATLETPIEDIPASPGVYLLYGQETAPLYIGSASNLRQRVGAHLKTPSKTARDRRIVDSTQRVEWRETAGELGALLLAKRLISTLLPRYGSGKPAVQVGARALQPWPYHGVIGLREHDAETGRSELHLFQDWHHLASAQDESELASALASASMAPRHMPETASDTHPHPPPMLTVDLDVYRLVVKRLHPTARGRMDVLLLPGLTSVHGD
jgi:DNA polymerase III epsilon subunit family exonuclease